MADEEKSHPNHMPPAGGPPPHDRFPPPGMLRGPPPNMRGPPPGLFPSQVIIIYHFHFYFVGSIKQNFQKKVRYSNSGMERFG